MGKPNPDGSRAMTMWLERQKASIQDRRHAEYVARLRLAEKEAAERAARDVTPPDAD